MSNPRHPDGGGPGATGGSSDSVGSVVDGGITEPDFPDDPDLPENRGRPAAQDAGHAPPLAPREPLSRERIIAAAVAFIDTEGLPSLTMHRLGDRLGVRAMALYRYVPSRERLLDAVVASVVDELYDDPDVYLEPQHGWQDYLHRLAHGVRRIALAHPALFPLIATRPPDAPWVRPPLRSLDWVESFLTALRTHGFSRDQAVEAYRAYTSFLLGHLLLEVAQRGVAINAVDDPDGHPASSPAQLDDRYVNIADLEPLLSLDETVLEFEQSLENLIGRLDAMVDNRTSHL